MAPMLSNNTPYISYFNSSIYVKMFALIRLKCYDPQERNRIMWPSTLLLEVIKVNKANQVEFMLNFNYIVVHIECVKVTNIHSYTQAFTSPAFSIHIVYVKECQV